MSRPVLTVAFGKQEIAKNKGLNKLKNLYYLIG
jgi:hypothetical protein